MEVSVCKKTITPRISKHIILTLLSTSIVFCTATFTVISSFYPILAIELQIPASTVGLIFSAFEIGLLSFSSPLTVLTNYAGLKFTFISCLFVCSASTFLFSFLKLGGSTDSFIVLSFMIRLFQGASYFGVQSSCITIVTDLYPNDLSKAVGIIEIANGIGYSIGPPIGGIFYQLGGFMSPFIFVSIICFMVFILMSFCTSTKDSNTEIESKEEISGLKLFKKIMLIPDIYIGVLNLAIFTASYVYFDISISPFLNQEYGLQQYEIGLIFTGQCILYGVSGPLVGHICDKYKNPLFLMFLGSLINTIIYFCLGPAVKLGFPSNLGFTIPCFVIVGISSACMYVPVMAFFLKAVRKHGIPETKKTKGYLSSILSIGGGFGGLIGPILGGILLENMSFRDTCNYFTAFNLTLMCVLLIRFIPEYFCKARNQKTPESNPLLH